MAHKPSKQKGNFIFICQVAETTIKIAKCLIVNALKREFVVLEAHPIKPGISDEELSVAINQIFKNAGYDHYPVVISLPRSYATSRYLKIPTQSPQEIENITLLQAPRYLPYPSEELISGYQVVSTEKNGYSNINLIITHKNTIERLIRIFKNLKASRIDIELSSYGLLNLCQQVKPDSIGMNMVADIDVAQTEIAVIAFGKLIFSRSFKFASQQPDKGILFLEEINKTRDACAREIGEKAPSSIMLTGIKSACEEIAQKLNAQGIITAEVLKYDKTEFGDYSFAAIIGLGMRDAEDSFNLLPRQMKETAKKSNQKKESLKFIAYIAGIIFILMLAITKNMDNKRLYLKRLKSEIAKIANDAKPFEAIEKRMLFVKQHSRKKISGLDVLYQLHKNMPEGAALTSLAYDEDGQVILQGQSPELKYVFELSSRLEKLPVFKNSLVKVRYASKKNVQSAEIIDFEIDCLKK